MVAAALVLWLNQAQPAHARGYVDIVSTSVIYPFAEAVADTIAARTGFVRPRVAMLETRAALKAFCDSNGLSSPDIVGTSRRIHREEIEHCVKNGVADIIEIPIGYLGIVLVRARPAPLLALNVQDIYLAVKQPLHDSARKDTMLSDRVMQWSQVNRELPNLPINFVGPSRHTDIRYAFEQLAVFRSCIELNPYAARLKERTADLNYAEQLTLQGLCTHIREDGRYQSVDDVASLIGQLIHDPGKIGILEYNSLRDHMDHVRPLPVNGILPTVETIATGQYPLAQPLFLYIKKTHLDQVPGLWPYLAFFTSEGQMGPAGDLVKNGLIPLPTEQRRYAKGDLEAQKTSQLLAVTK
jgi:phosphate transport system substrate-binding protein